MKKIVSVFICIAILVSAFMFSGCELNKKPEKDAIPAMLMFKGGTSDLNVGELYIQEYNGEKERIAESAVKDEYLLSPKTHDVLVLNNENELYCRTKSGDKYRVAEKVLKSSFAFSYQENAYGLITKNGDADDSPAELYIKYSDGEKEKVSSDMAKDASTNDYKLSDDGSSVYFRDKDNNLYKWNKNNDKEKLASNVSGFNTFADCKAYTYSNNEGNYYVKFANDTESQRIDEKDIGNIALSQDGLIAIFLANMNYDKGYGELYAAIKGSSSIRIASNVKSFYSTDSGNIYFLNDDNALYVKNILKVDENTYKDASKLKDNISNSEKIKLGSDISWYVMSPDGENVAFVDTDSNLYISCDSKEKTKLSADIVSADIFNDKVIFKNKDNELYNNKKITSKNISREDNELISKDVSAYSTTPNGQYVSFILADKNSLNLYEDGQEIKTYINDCTEFDNIIIQYKTLYEKKLLLSDIVGIYKNSDLGVAYKITNDSKFILYERGEEVENSELKITGINKISASLKSSNPDSVLSKNNYTISVSDDGKRILNIDDKTYNLTLIDDDGLKKEIERQKKVVADEKAAAERKAAAEKAAAELAAKKQKQTEVAEKYMRNGVYVSSYQTLYFSPDYGSASNYTFTTGGNRTVYDYKISSDGNTIWLKLYTYSSGNSGYNGYVWVAM